MGLHARLPVFGRYVSSLEYMTNSSMLHDRLLSSMPYLPKLDRTSQIRCQNANNSSSTCTSTCQHNWPSSNPTEFVQRIIEDGINVRYTCASHTSRAGLTMQLGPWAGPRHGIFLFGVYPSLYSTNYTIPDDQIYLVDAHSRQETSHHKFNKGQHDSCIPTAHHFQISEDERASSVKRAQVARMLTKLCCPNVRNHSPSHLEGDDWNQISVSAAPRLPDCRRMFSATPAWEFRGDPSAHYGPAGPASTATSAKQTITISGTCQQRFINTTAMLVSTNPSQIPHAVLSMYVRSSRPRSST
jgi:hypothetical protein